MLKKIVALAALALATSSSALSAPGGCHAVSGTFVNHNIPCTVPAVACVESEVTGGLAGVTITIVTSYDPVTHVYAGTVTNNLENGAVLTSTIVGTTFNGFGQSTETLTGGTRQFAHVTGSTAEAGVNGAGTYTADYCLGQVGGDD
jgi:hypothetical protein